MKIEQSISGPIISVDANEYPALGKHDDVEFHERNVEGRCFILSRENNRIIDGFRPGIWTITEIIDNPAEIAVRLGLNEIKDKPLPVAITPILSEKRFSFTPDNALEKVLQEEKRGE